jgi:hypothetical protein
MGERRLARREDLEPLSVQGRAAGVTAGACALLSGLTLMWSGWFALTCPLGGVRGRTLCSRTSGIGGLTVMLGFALAVLGAGILWRTGRRLIEPGGSSGWTWGEGVSILLGGLMIAGLIPTYHCPAGWELTPIFHVCRTATAIDMHPPTWLAWKFGIAAAGIVLCIVVGRWRRLPWAVASAMTVAVVGGATWYLTQKISGLPSFG